jgi:hypothetical protein
MAEIGKATVAVDVELTERAKQMRYEDRRDARLLRENIHRVGTAIFWAGWLVAGSIWLSTLVQVNR